MTESNNRSYRKGLRERFVHGEESSYCEEALLALLLAYAIPRKDVQVIAKSLLAEFGGLANLLGTPIETLSRSKSVRENTAVLLKLVDWVRRHYPAKRSIKETVMTSPQASLFEVPTEEKKQKPGLIKREPRRVALTPAKTPSPKKSVRRKFQVSNGYLLEFDQLARILHFLLEHRSAKKISRKDLREDTGLADRQVESLVSMASAMGLIKPGVQLLTREGLLIAKHDLFLERLGTLEWCHYKGAGSYQNLIWFEVFNRLVTEKSAMTEEGWQEYYRNKLKSQYTDKTIKDHVPKEVRFIVDAYTNRNFKKLEILNLSDERLYRRRYTGFAPLVCAHYLFMGPKWGLNGVTLFG